MSTKLPLPTKKEQEPQTKAKSRFIIVHGDKGGVGKSFVAQAIANHLLTKGEKIAIIEADTANPDVKRMFARNAPSAMTQLRSEDGWMDLMDFVVTHPGYTFVMNTPAGIGEHMQEDMTTFARFLSAHDAKIEMELWWTMNVQHDSVNLFSKAIAEYGDFFSRIRVVCNMHFSDGNVGPFFLWQESPLRTRLEKKGGLTIFFPGLNLRVVTKLYDPKNIMPFADAADAVIGERVNLMPSECWKLKQWLADIDTVLTPAFAATDAPTLACEAEA